MVKFGSIENRFSPGRPKEYTDEFWGSLCTIHKEVQTETNRKPMVAALQAELALDFEQVASASAVLRFKRTRFETKKVTPKPIVSKVAQEKRYKFAKKCKHHKWTRWVVMDMKWFYEVGAAGHEVEQDLLGPPLPPTQAAVPGEDG